MEYVTVLIQSIIRFIHFSLNSIFLINSSKKDHLTQSYALLISNLSAIKPPFLELYLCKLCKVSKAIVMLSNINLSLLKANWCSVIIIGSSVFKRLASTLEKILYKLLQRLIGQNWCTYSGFLVFGMSVTKVWFQGWGRVREFSHDKTEVVTSLSTMLQKCW